LTDSSISGARTVDWLGQLADLQRLRVLHACEQQELSVAELCAVLQVPQSTASRHLKVLADASWLASRREGTSRLYSVDRDGLPPPARKLWKVVREQCEASPVLRADAERLSRVLRERQSRSQAFFASTAGEWDRLRGDLFGQGLEAATLAGLLGSGARVGDLGCGTGRTTELLARFARRVVAVDGSAAMIKAARQRLAELPNVELHRADLAELPLEDAALDAAFLSLVLHHVSDPAAVLTEVARVMAPRSRLVILDMQEHDRAEYRQQMGHVWLGFAPGQIDGWLRAAGLEPDAHVTLPAEPGAKGPPLFVATARRQAR
jgi:ArsR family transcriptional regulator